MGLPDLPAPLEFARLGKHPGIVHGVYPRTGGTSSAPYTGLNIGLNCGDASESVLKNRRMMLDSIGVSRAVFLNQVHGTHIHVLKNPGDTEGAVWNPDTGETPCPVTADGVVTNIPDLALVIQVADCQAVILYDPVNRVIANVHSGWRGSVAGILGKCTQIMADEFSSRPGDIIAGISPSLGPCCSEFVNYRTEIPRRLWGYKSQDRPW
ncbi:MAG: polyphenol oxidase family protein, partial [Desulfobacterales bacterium]|nr:polyphenol oxidase family protein [Desulfobacterales bacterium]